MEYLLGGCTGLLKEAETTNRSLLRLSLVDDQSLDKSITSMCWSGGFGGYSEDELTVGYKDGSLISYNYLTMKINREHKLDSKSIYITMLNRHFDVFTHEIYKKNKDSPLYPEYKRPDVYDNNDRLLLAVTENGYIYIFDWSVEKDGSVSRVKHLGKNVINVNKEGNAEKENSDFEEYTGAIFVYKCRGPVKDAKVHSIMKNRLILGGTSNPPVLVDLFAESILWTGKFPHETVLGLQSPLDITSLCFMEELDDDLICVATRDSYLYVYDPKSQRDPIFEFNICDYRSIGLSKKLLYLHHEDYNTKHRKRLSKSINVKYSQTDRAILRLATRPSFTLHFVESSSSTDPIKKEFCSLYVCDNFGTIYNIQFLTGDRLLWWIYRKIKPHVELSHLTHTSNTHSNPKNSRTFNTISNHNANTESTDASNTTNSTSSTNNTNTNNTYVNNTGDPELPEDAASRGSIKRELSVDDVYNLNEAHKYKIVEHLLEARKRLCSSSNNDKKIHFRKNNYSQLVCRILNCYNFHNGSVVDISCIGDYLISASLDRHSNIVNLRTGKLVSSLYCNQKQTCILVKNKHLLTSFNDRVEFKSLKPDKLNSSKASEYADNESDQPEDDDEFHQQEDINGYDLPGDAVEGSDLDDEPHSIQSDVESDNQSHDESLDDLSDEDDASDGFGDDANTGSDD